MEKQKEGRRERKGKQGGMRLLTEYIEFEGNKGNEKENKVTDNDGQSRKTYLMRRKV